MSESSGYGELRFLPHEAAPLSWNSVGITEEREEESSRKVVSLLGLLYLVPGLACPR